MNSEIKHKLEDLVELHRLGYVTEEEYATARENLLLDMGFDIVPRVGGLRDRVLIAEPRRRSSGCGCGCFLMLLLLLIAAVGGVFAVPEEMLRQVPGLNRVLEFKEYQEVRQALMWFLDDLRGNPLSAPDPVPLTSNDPQNVGRGEQPPGPMAVPGDAPPPEAPNALTASEDLEDEGREP